MKPASFEYHDPATVEAVLGLLAKLGEDAKVLAGGQSLVPMMNFRLARPAHVVDLNRVPGLAGVRVDGGELSIGAMTRQRDVERSAEVDERWPLLAGAVGHIGHVQIRNRGTVGGSLAHADPAAELPAAMLALDARFVVRSVRGTRVLPAGDFFLNAMTTALAADEILVEIRVPPLPRRTGWAFHEVSRRQGDFALVGAAALLTLGAADVIERARLAFTGAGPRPTRARHAEDLLVGAKPDADIVATAARAAAAQLTPESDLHASADYRREVGGVLAGRALTEAAARAREAR